MSEFEKYALGRKYISTKEQVKNITRILMNIKETPQQRRINQMTPEELFREIQLIKNKKSSFSAKERLMIKARYQELINNLK